MYNKGRRGWSHTWYDTVVLVVIGTLFLGTGLGSPTRNAEDRSSAGEGGGASETLTTNRFRIIAINCLSSNSVTG